MGGPTVAFGGNFGVTLVKVLNENGDSEFIERLKECFDLGELQAYHPFTALLQYRFSCRPRDQENMVECPWDVEPGLSWRSATRVVQDWDSKF